MAGVDVDTLTKEQYLAFSRENQAPGVVKPEIGGNVNFEIKSQFMHQLREDTFSENKDADAHDHIDRVLSTIGLFNIPGVSKDAVMLRVLPFTLTGSAKRWVDRLTPGTINTWDLLKKVFIQRYCPPFMAAKQLEYIYNFKQEGDESLYQAWERYNDLLYKCPTYDINNHQKTMADHSQKWHNGTTSMNIGSSSSKDGLTALVNKLDNVVRDMKKLKESVHTIQVGCQMCEGPHLDKDCPINEEVKQVEEIDNRPPYGEKRQSLEELLAKHQEESARRKQIKTVTSDQETSGLNKLHGVSFISRPKSTTPKILQHQLPPKELNPRSFTLPCMIGKFNFYTMADLGASINVMPRSIFEHSHLINLKKTNMLYEMADMSKKAPLGIVENVLVKIDKFLFPVDFVILNNTPSETTILGRPFLATIHVEIDVFAGKISLGINEDRISFDTMKKDHNYTNPSEFFFMVRPQFPGQSNNQIDYEESDDSAIVNNPTNRSFDDYKWEFNLEIDKLADEYELGIGKKGYILDNIWENCNHQKWHNYEFENE
ncbi:hypothetical protein Tco_0031960 [Tanacetum coccineum]